MNKENAKGYLPLVQALAEGKTIQFRDNRGCFVDADNLDFCYPPSEYRIKPEPREYWLLPGTALTCSVSACHIITDNPPTWVKQDEVIRVREIID